MKLFKIYLNFFLACVQSANKKQMAHSKSLTEKTLLLDTQVPRDFQQWEATTTYTDTSCLHLPSLKPGQKPENKGVQ